MDDPSDTESVLYEVERILRKSKASGKTLYKVRWQGYGPEDDTWEPADNLESCLDLIEDFERKQKEQMKKRVEERRARKAVMEGKLCHSDSTDESNAPYPSTFKNTFWKELEAGRVNLFDNDMYSKVKNKRVENTSRSITDSSNTDEAESIHSNTASTPANTASTSANITPTSASKSSSKSSTSSNKPTGSTSLHKKSHSKATKKSLPSGSHSHSKCKGTFETASRNSKIKDTDKPTIKIYTESSESDDEMLLPIINLVLKKVPDISEELNEKCNMATPIPSPSYTVIPRTVQPKAGTTTASSKKKKKKKHHKHHKHKASASPSNVGKATSHKKRKLSATSLQDYDDENDCSHSQGTGKAIKLDTGAEESSCDLLNKENHGNIAGPGGRNGVKTEANSVMDSVIAGSTDIKHEHSAHDGDSVASSTVQSPEYNNLFNSEIDNVSNSPIRSAGNSLQRPECGADNWYSNSISTPNVHSLTGVRIENTNSNCSVEHSLYNTSTSCDLSSNSASRSQSTDSQDSVFTSQVPADKGTCAKFTHPASLNNSAASALCYEESLAKSDVSMFGSFIDSFSSVPGQTLNQSMSRQSSETFDSGIYSPTSEKSGLSVKKELRDGFGGETLVPLLSGEGKSCNRGADLEIELDDLNWELFDTEVTLKPINISNDEFCTAVKSCNYEVVKQALLGDGKYDMNRPDVGGKTLLMYAIQQGQDDICDMLIENGADINAQTHAGLTPLLIACQSAKISTVNLLLELGAKVNLAASDGSTPLIVAAKRGHTQILWLLLECGANFNRVCHTGHTAMEIVRHLQHIEMDNILTNHISRVMSEFDKQVSITLNQTAQVTDALFPAQLYNICDGDRFEYTFQHNLLPPNSGVGYLLFICQAVFTSQEVQCRLYGPCAVKSVFLNGHRQSSLTEGGNFVLAFSPLVGGNNTITINTVKAQEAKAKLIMCAYKAQLLEM